MKHSNYDSNSFFARNSKDLVETALGRKAPDLAVVNATLFNVYTNEICPHTTILVSGKRIARLMPNDDFIKGPATQVFDAQHLTVIPGLIDGHTHLAWLAQPDEFLRYAAVTGITTIITETLEIYPSAGLAGVEDFMAALKGQPVKILGTAAAMGSISSNALGISGRDLNELLKRDDIVGLGESYWQTVLQHPDAFFSSFEQTAGAGKRIEGHSAGAGGGKLAAYTALGVSSCHEGINADQILERLRNGLYTMIREGSIRSDLSEIAQIKNENIDFRRLCLVSDGITPGALLKDGYMDTIVQKAIDEGFDPKDAVRMASLNVAENFGLSDHIGGIAPGRYADMVIIPDIKNIIPCCVISSGRIISKTKKLNLSPKKHHWKTQSRNSVCLPKPVRPSDFAISTARWNGPGWEQNINRNRKKKKQSKRVTVRVMELITDLVTKECMVSMQPDEDNTLGPDFSRDIIKISAIDRNLSPGEQFTGFIKGFGLKKGAFAATGAWDTSNIIVVGGDNEDMAFAVNRIKDLQGGIVVCRDRKILAELPLPLFGVMSDLSLEAVAVREQKIIYAVKELGTDLTDPLLTLTTLTGAAIPYIRICEQGLVDLKTGRHLSLEYKDV